MATVVAAAVAVVQLVLPRGGQPEAPGAAPAVAASSSTVTQSAGRPSGVATGSCLDAARAVVACTAFHEYEVVGGYAGGCPPADLVRHLGGHPDRDVVRVAATPLDVGSQRVCAVRDPDGATSAVPAKDALRAPDSARWRRCADDRVGDDDVSCARDHTAEFVGSDGVAAPDAAACKRAAEAYLNTAFDRLSDQLAVAVVPAAGADRAHCLIRVLGRALLTDTLRGIGVRALPLRAA